MIDFLNLSKEVYGLEITDTHVRMMRLERQQGRLNAIAAGCLPLEGGIVKNGDIYDEKKLAIALQKLIIQAAGKKKSKRYAVISLPETKAFLQVIDMPRLNAEELRAAIVFEAENYIPLPLEKVYLDFEKVSPVLLRGNRCEVAVTAIPRETVDSYVGVCDVAGLTPIAMELESQAAVRAARESKNLQAPIVIIKIGDAQSSIIVYAAGSIRAVFSSPVSNHFFLEKISSAVGVEAARAEMLKFNYGIEDFQCSASLPDDGDNAEKKKIFEALMPCLVDFSQQVKKYIRYYQTHENFAAQDKEDFKKALICGSGSSLKGLDEFLSFKLGIAVERLVLPIGVDLAHFKNADFLKNGAHGCAVVAGLAMRALAIESDENEAKEILPVPVPSKNLLQRIEIKTKTQAKK